MEAPAPPANGAAAPLPAAATAVGLPVAGAAPGSLSAPSMAAAPAPGAALAGAPAAAAGSGVLPCTADLLRKQPDFIRTLLERVAQQPQAHEVNVWRHRDGRLALDTETPWTATPRPEVYTLSVIRGPPSRLVKVTAKGGPRTRHQWERKP